MRQLVKLVIIVFLASYGWRYSREVIRGSLGHITPVSSIWPEAPAETPEGEHYSPDENLETLDYQAIQKTRHTLEICMSSFTDIRLARAVLDAAHRGVEVKLYRDGEEYEQEQMRSNVYGSTTNLFRGQSNIHIRVKPPSTTGLMHTNYVAVMNMWCSAHILCNRPRCGGLNTT